MPGKAAGQSALAPYPQEDRKVARDGFVSWEESRHGVHRKLVGRTVQVGQRQRTPDVRARDERIEVHSGEQKTGRRFVLPGQWSGLPVGVNRPKREAMAVQVPVSGVKRRCLDVHELVAVVGAI